MKKTIKQLTVIALIAFTSFSFTIDGGEKKEIKPGSSVIWKGYKVTGSHQGTISIKSGYLTFEKDKFSGGEFMIDMNSLTNTDMEGEYKEKLEGHLKSNDFFGVEKFPSAKLIIKKTKSTGKNSYEASGDLTIKGITNPITFNVSVYGSKANASLKIDRSKYNVKYGSTSFFEGLKDKAIYDEFDLIVDLEF